MNSNVRFFKEDAPFGELSNFYRLTSPVIFDGKEYFTSESLYHACKYIFPEAPDVNKEYIEHIRTASTPYKSKLLANMTKSHKYQWNEELNTIIDTYTLKGVKRRDDWEQVKDYVMKYVLLLKFKTDKHCYHVLLSTGSAKLIEASPYDNYWGCGKDGKGLNKLGTLLEQVRKEIIH